MYTCKLIFLMASGLSQIKPLLYHDSQKNLSIFYFELLLLNKVVTLRHQELAFGEHLKNKCTVINS